MLRKNALTVILIGLFVVASFSAPATALARQAPAAEPVTYQAGAAKVDVTPTDWELRTYWMAGYGPFRPVTSIHDPLMARVLIIDDGATPMAIVTLDEIGVTSNDAAIIQAAIAQATPDLAGHILVHSTHTHEGPDTIGIWGGAGSPPFAHPRPLDYIEYIAQQAAAAAQQAWNERQPVHITLASLEGRFLQDLFRDTRPPYVFDPAVRFVRFEAGEQVVATLVNWASHPEVLGSENEAVTADYVNWTMAEIEEQTGGVALFVNGAIGGLLTSEGGDILPQYPRYSFEKAEALGRLVADRLLRRLENLGSNDIVQTYDRLPPLDYSTRRFYIPVENPLLILAQRLNRVPKTMYYQFQIPQQERWRLWPLALYTDTEANFITFGPAAILTMGGELYSELLVGGIEPLGDPPYNEAPPEPPLVRNPNFALYSFKFFFGLTNDFMGYVIPQSEWDGWEGGEYGEDFATTYDEGSIISWNMHLLLLGYETGEYPDASQQTPGWLLEPDRQGALSPHRAGR